MALRRRRQNDFSRLKLKPERAVDGVRRQRTEEKVGKPVPVVFGHSPALQSVKFYY